MLDMGSVSVRSCAPCHHKCSISGEGENIATIKKFSLLCEWILRAGTLDLTPINARNITRKHTSAGTYWSTAVATVAQQIQIRTSTERMRVVVRIHPGSHGFLRTRLHVTHAFDWQNWYRIKSIHSFLGNAETAKTTLKGSWISCSRYRSCGRRSCLCLSPGLKHGGILWKLGCSIRGLEERNNRLAERVCLYLNTSTPMFSLLV